MSTFAAVVVAIGAMFGLAGIVGGIWATARSSAKDTTEKRLRSENEDYLRRLDYVEPRLKRLEEQNALLLQLHDPTKQLGDLTTNQATILRLLSDQGRLLNEIHARMVASA